MIAASARPLLTLPELARLAGGDLAVRAVPEGAAAREAWLKSGIDGVSIDTRTLARGDLFVPLPGSRSDGHDFLEEAFRRGAAAALCARARHAALAGREPGPLVVVEEVTGALLQLARRYREGWPCALVGVSGSAGKTTIKDLVAAVLATDGPTLKTEGNLNNQWGVPLTLLRLRGEHRAAVVEIGTSAPGEIALLAAVSLPNAAVITNAGTAHLEGLGSLAAIAAEKAALGFALRAGEPLFAGADSPRLIAALAGVKARLVTFGLARGAAVRPERLEDLGPEGSRLEVAGFPSLHLRLVGAHQVRNALAALAVARERTLDPRAVVEALAAYRPTPGRMEVRSARGATLIVDCYNANPDSTAAALETLERWPGARRRIAVLGDMLELGPQAAALHRETGARVGGSELWAIGAHAEDYAAGARGEVRDDAGSGSGAGHAKRPPGHAKSGPPPRGFADFEALAAALRDALAPGVVVLLKASRGARLERVLEGLEREV